MTLNGRIKFMSKKLTKKQEKLKKEVLMKVTEFSNFLSENGFEYVLTAGLVGTEIGFTYAEGDETRIILVLHDLKNRIIESLIKKPKSKKKKQNAK